LAFIGGAAVTKGLATDLDTLILMSIERLILSFLLITLTMTEWAFKSKLTKEEKARIHISHSAVADNSVLD